MQFIEKLRQKTVLFDGAMGTWYAQQTGKALQNCERANLEDADTILEIHKAYIKAGCDAIKTNTFGANPRSLECDMETALHILQQGWKLAQQAAAGKDITVFADIGPIPAGETDAMPIYQAMIDAFLAQGAQYFLLETFGNTEELPAICAYLKKKASQSFVLTSFAVRPDGFSRDGVPVRKLYETMCADANTDAVGLNCVSGPAHLRRLIAGLPQSDKPLAVMPNAGYPTVVGRQTYFGVDAVYFGKGLAELAQAGAAIVGGCCGTNPDCIRQAHLQLQYSVSHTEAVPPKTQDTKPAPNPNRLLQKMQAGKRVIAVELDPPINADIRAFLAGAKALQEAGADAITIADCPVSRARADSSLLACKLKRELDIDPIPHMTCRDRNLNATKALLLGLNMEGVNNVLVVTGDPIPTADRDEIKSVYNFNSPKLARFINDLEPDLSYGPFQVFGALNLNAKNFEAQLNYAKLKIEHGVSGFLTQPVHSEQALENLKLAHQTLNAKILGGLMPIVSHRNACFMNNEIAGISVSEEIVKQYEGLDRAQAEELAYRITLQIAHEMQAFVDGYYMITPFMRTELMCRILKALQD